MLTELLKRRRTIRKYTDEKVKDSEIKKIIEAGLLAPSGRGNNNWEFIILDNPEDIRVASLSKSDKENFGTYCSHMVMVLVDKEQSPSTYPEDAAIVATLMQLRATELGIGSCWIHQRTSTNPEGISANEYLRDHFDIPENMVVDMMMSFGYPDEEKDLKEIESFKDKVHYNRYNNREGYDETI